MVMDVQHGKFTKISSPKFWPTCPSSFSAHGEVSEWVCIVGSKTQENLEGAAAV